MLCGSDAPPAPPTEVDPEKGNWRRASSAPARVLSHASWLLRRTLVRGRQRQFKGADGWGGDERAFEGDGRTDGYGAGGERRATDASEDVGRGHAEDG